MTAHTATQEISHQSCVGWDVFFFPRVLPEWSFCFQPQWLWQLPQSLWVRFGKSNRDYAVMHPCYNSNVRGKQSVAESGQTSKQGGSSGAALWLWGLLGESEGNTPRDRNQEVSVSWIWVKAKIGLKQCSKTQNMHKKETEEHFLPVGIERAYGGKSWWFSGAVMSGLVEELEGYVHAPPERQTGGETKAKHCEGERELPQQLDPPGLSGLAQCGSLIIQDEELGNVRPFLRSYPFQSIMSLPVGISTSSSLTRPFMW